MMGEREIREKYGGKLAKAINRATRAETPGGNAALDKLAQLSAPILQAGWKDHHGNPTPEAAAFARHKRNVVDKLEALVRSKWGIAVEKAPLAKPRRRRSAAGDPADRTPARAYRRSTKTPHK